MIATWEKMEKGEKGVTFTRPLGGLQGEKIMGEKKGKVRIPLQWCGGKKAS